MNKSIDNYITCRYNIDEKRQTDRRLALEKFIRNNRQTLAEHGGYFFFVILTTSAIMETIRESNKYNSLYVIISTALLSGGKSALRLES